MISVIIPTYNTGDFLVRAIVSLENQTYRDFEVIAVDDGSTDNTDELLDQYIRLGTGLKIKKIKQDHSGANVARNLGFSHSIGDYILFLDADDILVPNALEKFLITLEKYPKRAYAYCRFRRDGHEHNPGKFSSKKLISGKQLINTASLIRRRYFCDFDPNLKRLQDRDLWLSILRLGGRGVLVKKDVLFESFSRPGDITSTENLIEADDYIKRKYADLISGEVSSEETILRPIEPSQEMELLPQEMGLVEIVILRYGSSRMLGTDKDCFEALIKNTSYPYVKMTWFDNYQYKYSLGKAWNELIKQSNAEYIVLLHNDVKVEKKWLKKLLKVFEEEGVGAVGPSFNKCWSIQKITKRKRGKELIDLGERYGKAFQLDSACLIFSKKVWEEVGGFNENFELSAEKEFLHRVQKKGYRTIWRKDVLIQHKMSVSSKKRESEDRNFDLAETRKKDQKLYIKKVKASK